jgi:L-serine dehydratase
MLFQDYSSKLIKFKGGLAMSVVTAREKKNVSYKSCFDVIGPVMIGPSSSHTAGALAMGLVANKLFKGLPKKVVVKYYESFAETHKGHGTDFAIISGILGFEADDSRVPDAIKIAESQGIDITFLEESGDSPAGHPNTADIYLQDDSRYIRTMGISVGGGLIKVKHIEIDGFSLHPQGSLPIMIAISDRNNLELELHRIFKKHDVDINNSISLEKDGKYLYQFDLDSQLSRDARKELEKLSEMAKIIIL